MRKCDNCKDIRNDVHWSQDADMWLCFNCYDQYHHNFKEYKKVREKYNYHDIQIEEC